MCNIWKITYTCKHTLETKRSTCRGIIKNTKVEKFDMFGRPRPRSSACLQIADTYLLYDQECGPCTLRHLEERLDDEIHTIRLRIAPHSSRETRLEAKRQIVEIEKRKIEACMTLPQMNWEVPEPIVYGGRKPGQKSKSKERRIGTLLKLEVRPEDVCGDDMYEVVKADLEAMSRGWDDKSWGSEFKKLGEELVEDQEAAAASSDEDLEAGCRDNDSSDDEGKVDSDSDSDSSGDEDHDDWCSTLNGAESASNTSESEAITTFSFSDAEFETSASSDNANIATSAILSMTASPIRLNGPHDTVSPPTETCNPATRGRLADRSSHQIAPTLVPNVDKENDVRFRVSGEDKKTIGCEPVANEKKMMSEGGLKTMAMQVVTL